MIDKKKLNVTSQLSYVMGQSVYDKIEYPTSKKKQNLMIILADNELCC